MIPDFGAWGLPGNGDIPGSGSCGLILLAMCHPHDPSEDRGKTACSLSFDPLEIFKIIRANFPEVIVSLNAALTLWHFEFGNNGQVSQSCLGMLPFTCAGVGPLTLVTGMSSLAVLGFPRTLSRLASCWSPSASCPSALSLEHKEALTRRLFYPESSHVKGKGEDFNTSAMSGSSGWHVVE